uniref:Dual specificity protein phosphatase 12 n=1 Tax=Cacopsylla melanoneura TaxID=428564 RepID=A0A8D9A3F3_9HEMI
MPNLIEPNLYLGDLNDAVALKSSNELDMKFVFSVGYFPTLDKVSKLTYHHIEVADLPSEDLLSYFDSAYDFISDNLSKGAPILVHCYHGMSRSATIVIAYLMKHHKLDVTTAFDRVKSCRDVICPNDGFMHQLELYGRMHCALDLNFPPYKLYRLKKLSQIVKDVRLVPSSQCELIKTDPGLASNRPNPNVYKCKKCRRVLFTVNNTLGHNRGEKFTWKTVTDTPHSGAAGTGVAGVGADRETQPCADKIFIEPLAWMKDVKICPSGKLTCPRCNFKLGSYSWIDYCVCTCGTKIFPFFYATPSKIDFDNVVKNVQVTV